MYQNFTRTIIQLKIRNIKIHTEDEITYKKSNINQTIMFRMFCILTPRYTEGWMMSQPLSITSLMA